MNFTGLCLLLALLGALAGVVASGRAPRFWLGSVLASSAFAVAAAFPILAGGGEWAWRGGLRIGGEAVFLRLDGLSAFFLALVAVVGAAAAVYAGSYWPDRAHPRTAPRSRFWWCILLLSMGLVLLASNGLHFLIAWEVFVVSGLLSRSRWNPRSGRCGRRAGSIWPLRMRAPSACSCFFATLAARLGTWELGPMRGHPELAPLFWLVLLGIRREGGPFPAARLAALGSRERADPCLRDLLGRRHQDGDIRDHAFQRLDAGARRGRLGDRGARGGRARSWASSLPWASTTSSGCSPTTASRTSGSSSSASASRSWRRSTGTPVWGGLALAGALLHVWNHGLFKALLFLGAGSVAACDRHEGNEPARRAFGGACPGRGLLRPRRRGDLGAAAAQRIRQRMARLSRPVRGGRRAAARPSLAADRRGHRSGHDGRPGARLLHQGLRRRFPRRAALEGRRRRRANAGRSCCAAMGVWPRPASRSGSPPPYSGPRLRRRRAPGGTAWAGAGAPPSLGPWGSARSAWRSRRPGRVLRSGGASDRAGSGGRRPGTAATPPRTRACNTPPARLPPLSSGGLPGSSAPSAASAP